MNNRIALGTVQFGLRYGVANHAGQVSLAEAQSILASARLHSISTLDTAIAYGTSEQVLGQMGVHDFEIISKMPGVPDDCGNVQAWVVEQAQESLARLGVSRLSGLLLHRPDQLLSSHGPAIYDALQTLKERDLVDRIGVSIYRPDILDQLFDHMTFDLVQAPFNLLDRRLLTSGWMDRLAEMDVELHVRSLFLQGLLVMPPGRRPAYFDRWSALWDGFDGWLAEHQMTALQACLRYALSLPAIGKVVVGVDSNVQLQEILAAAHGALPAVPPALASDDVELLEPMSWKLT